LEAVKADRSKHETDPLLALRYPLVTDTDFKHTTVYLDALTAAAAFDVDRSDWEKVAVFAGRVATVEATWLALKFEAYRIGWGRLTLPQQHKMRRATASLEQAMGAGRTDVEVAEFTRQAFMLASEVAAAGGFHLPDRAMQALSR
jgi:hypothetical protein